MLCDAGLGGTLAGPLRIERELPVARRGACSLTMSFIFIT